MILDFVVLKFLPTIASDEIREVYFDDLAWTLWIAIKQGHITSQYFNQGCLRAAKEIRKEIRKTGTITARTLHFILSFDTPRNLIGSDEMPFAEELLPFILGEKKISFETDWLGN